MDTGDDGVIHHNRRVDPGEIPEMVVAAGMMFNMRYSEQYNVHPILPIKKPPKT
jgi:hypothetical protein